MNFGDDNEAVSGTYMSIGNNEKIYLVNSSLKTDLQFEKNDLAKMEELPQIAVGNIKKIEISSESGVKTLQEEEVGGLWTLYKEDGSQVSVDTSKVNDYMNYFSSLSLMKFISYDISDLSAYGLDNPKKITVSYEEEQESEDASEELVSSLVTDYSLADMDKVTIERNGETYVLTRQETEVEGEDSEETTTETKYYLNDEEIQYEDISDFYSKVSGLEWQNMTEGQNGENAEIAITFEKEDGIKDKVSYYLYDENFYLVTKTDGSQMLVNKMKVREMIEAFDRMIENWKK